MAKRMIFMIDIILYCLKSMISMKVLVINFFFSFPMEMHMMFHNTKYSSVKEAKEMEDGLVVMAILFQVNFYIFRV